LLHPNQMLAAVLYSTSVQAVPGLAPSAIEDGGDMWWTALVTIVLGVGALWVLLFLSSRVSKSKTRRSTTGLAAPTSQRPASVRGRGPDSTRAPQSRAPQSRAPQSRAPQSRAPQSRAPQSRQAPDSTRAPQSSRAPDSTRAPQSSPAPQSSIPESAPRSIPRRVIRLYEVTPGQSRYEYNIGDESGTRGCALVIQAA